jgi:protocatechuate 3,4-dioxygenase beta subunit
MPIVFTQTTPACSLRAFTVMEIWQANAAGRYIHGKDN